MLERGAILDGRYEILEPLAEGGMGAVYRARRRLLEDEVAIKIVRSDFAADPAARERFLRESRACALLRHPNVVSILDFNVDAEGRPFLVMELLNGRSLRQELAARGRLPLEEVQQIIVPICGALQLAHDHGVLHRDIKPANIVAHDFGGGVRTHKIVDFGLVRVRETGDLTRLTAVDQFVGTVAYAAPEQMMGGSIDARSDLYSLAVVTYELLTGHLPFDASDPRQLVMAHVTKRVPPPTSLVPELPKWVDVVLGRALSSSQSARHESAAAFGDALASGSGVEARATVAMGGVRTPAAGGLLGTYELGERLGPGRLGSEVVRGTHRALGHPVAIRLLRRGGDDRSWDAARARFLREARSLQIAHPSIIQVRDYGEEGDLVYLVTDFIDGPSLRDVLRADGPMRWATLEPLLRQILDAARLLHRRHGLLCGLSPDIMRITEDEDGRRVMISTAGIWDAKDLLSTLGDATLHGSALADAELHYIAPELLTGEHADLRSDVFTLGVLAYEMATGVRPYDGASMPSLLGSMLRGAPADPRERQPTLPAAAAAAIVKALSPDPGARHASAAALAAELFESEPL